MKTKLQFQHVSIESIIETYSPGEGRHWFDKGACRFFRTRLPQGGYSGVGGVFFVTSECPPRGKRRYTVRQLVGRGSVQTVGPFCELGKSAAQGMAQRLAAGVESVPVAA